MRKPIRVYKFSIVGKGGAVQAITVGHWGLLDVDGRRVSPVGYEEAYSRTVRGLKQAARKMLQQRKDDADLALQKAQRVHAAELAIVAAANEKLEKELLELGKEKSCVDNAACKTAHRSRPT